LDLRETIKAAGDGLSAYAAPQNYELPGLIRASLFGYPNGKTIDIIFPNGADPDFYCAKITDDVYFISELDGDKLSVYALNDAAKTFSLITEQMPDGEHFQTGAGNGTYGGIKSEPSDPFSEDLDGNAVEWHLGPDTVYKVMYGNGGIWGDIEATINHTFKAAEGVYLSCAWIDGTFINMLMDFNKVLFVGSVWKPGEAQRIIGGYGKIIDWRGK
jgi:hypothetical protein